MKKLVFVSFAVSVLGEISENAYGMFNAQDKLQDASDHTSLIRAEFPANERMEEERNQSENNQIGNLEEQFSRLTTFGQNLIGNLGAQVSRLRTFAQTLLANAERKDKDQLEVYNYQIGNLKTEVAKLAALVETSLANAERKDKDQSEMYTNQNKDLKAEISKLETLVQNLNEKVAMLSKERESLIAKNDVKSQELVEQQEEAKSVNELEQQEPAQAKELEKNLQKLEHAKESNADKLAVDKEIDISSVQVKDIRSAIEEVLNELYIVAGKDATERRIQEFYKKIETAPKAIWVGSYKIEFKNGGYKFINQFSTANARGFEEFKKFLERVQTQINDARSCMKQEQES